MAAVPAGCNTNPDNPMMRKIFGPAPKTLVRQMFESKDPDLRREAIDKLADKSYGRGEPYLKGYMVLANDQAATVRSAAVRALGRGQDAKYIDVLTEALKDADSGVRWDATVALDSVLDEKAVGPLSLAAGDDDSVDVRIAAARALRHYPTRDSAEALLRCLSDGDFSVRYQACESLRELTGESARPDAGTWRDILTARDYSLTPKPTPKRRRPWWDWMGVTRRQTPVTQPTTAPR